MARVRRIQNSMTTGEVAPRLRGRSDLPQYGNALAELRDMVVMTLGGATRRGGSYWGGQAKDQTAAARLVRFRVSSEASYVLEFSAGALRFWRNRGPVMADAVPLELATPYAAGELRQLTFTRSLDVMYVFHVAHQTRKITRTGASTFTIETVAFVNGPYDGQNTGNVGVTTSPTSSAAETGTGGETVSGSGDTGGIATGGTEGGRENERDGGALGGSGGDPGAETG